jgi:hypothetical protein
MAQKSAVDIFRLEYGASKNFMTPDALTYGLITPSLAYELSEGEGLDRTPIFGVTIVEWKGRKETERKHDLSKMFATRKDAEDYIQSLKIKNKWP